MSTITEELELNKKHEGILGQRTELLGQMETRRQQLKSRRQQRVQEAQVARDRNRTLLEDLQKIEERLRNRQLPHLPHPNTLALETRYWASVEEYIPEWERFLLGRGPHPTDAPGPHPTDAPAPRRPKQRSSRAQKDSLPPRPKPRPVD